MGRENFAFTLTKVTKDKSTPVVVLVSQVVYLEPRDTGTVVYLVGAEPILVMEKVEEFERQGQSLGIFKVVKK